MPKVFVKENKSSLPSSIQISSYASDLPVRTLLSWQAPARPYRRKDRSYYTTIMIIVVLLTLISFLINEMLLIGAILAVAFITFVLAYVQPESIPYKVSTQGVTIGDHFYLWEVLDSFWFADKDGYRLIHIWTHLRFPGELILMPGDLNEDAVKEIIARFIPFHEIPPKTMFDRWAESIQKHFPLENPHRVSV